MNETTLHATKTALITLANDVIRMLSESGRAIEAFRGIAIYDTAKDAVITALPSFGPASSAIRAMPLVEERYGTESADRLALQWVYELLPRLADASFIASAEALWADFMVELNEPQWIFRGVANLRHFSDSAPGVVLGPIDGVTIQGRSFDQLASLGFDQFIIDALIEDWSGFGASSYVVVAEKRVDKARDNLVLSSDGSPWVNAIRLLSAMRLVAPGDISMGQMWLVRPVRFNVGIGGHSHTLWSIPAPPAGATYEVPPSLAPRIEQQYANLLHLAEPGYGQGPGNLDLALRSFMATYDRWPIQADSQLIDSITAAEAVIGTETEITFRLAFRMAGLLAANASEREEVFKAMKSFYDVRSKLVHGGALKPKHTALLKDVSVLRSYVRRLLAAFVTLAVSGSTQYDRKFFAERLDLVLQDEEGRRRLRSDLGL